MAALSLLLPHPQSSPAAITHALRRAGEENRTREEDRGEWVGERRERSEEGYRQAYPVASSRVGEGGRGWGPGGSALPGRVLRNEIVGRGGLGKGEGRAPLCPQPFSLPASRKR